MKKIQIRQMLFSQLMELAINNPKNWSRCIYIFNEQNLKVTDELESYKREIKDLDYIQKSFEQDQNGRWISNN